MKTLLKNGLIIDGSGKKGFIGNVLMDGDKIAKIGDSEANAENADEIIDCTGKIICPGFVDVHTHDDAIALETPEMLPKISQGITTVITGNCGISLVPLRTQKPIAPLNLLNEKYFIFNELSDYENAINLAKPALNVASLIGHTSLRACVMDNFDRPASADEIQKMSLLLEKAMQKGALGLSSGVFYTNSYAADEAELVALASVAAKYGGVYTTHIRNEMQHLLAAVKEAANTAKQAKLPLVLSHHKCALRALWGLTKDSLALIDKLSEDQQIALDVYPYTAGSTILREDLVDGEVEVLITQSEPFPEMAGKFLAEIAKDWQLTQQEAARKLMPGGACYFQMSEEDVKRVLSHPKTMIGSDGLPHDKHPHPRLWGTFPRVLGHYCLELSLFSLENIIARMSSYPATQFSLEKRGLLAPDYFADVLVFNPETIIDKATFADPLQASEGVSQVFVNGVLAYAEQDGAMQQNGRFLRRAN